MEPISRLLANDHDGGFVVSISNDGQYLVYAALFTDQVDWEADFDPVVFEAGNYYLIDTFANSVVTLPVPPGGTFFEGSGSGLSRFDYGYTLLPDGSQVASISDNGGSIYLVDTETLELTTGPTILSLIGEGVRIVEISNDGEVVTIEGNARLTADPFFFEPAVQSFYLATGEPIGEPISNGLIVGPRFGRSAAVSEDGYVIANVSVESAFSTDPTVLQVTTIDPNTSETSTVEIATGSHSTASEGTFYAPVDITDDGQQVLYGELQIEGSTHNTDYFVYDVSTGQSTRVIDQNLGTGEGRHAFGFNDDGQFVNSFFFTFDTSHISRIAIGDEEPPTGIAAIDWVPGRGYGVPQATSENGEVTAFRGNSEQIAFVDYAIENNLWLVDTDTDQFLKEVQDGDVIEYDEVAGLNVSFVFEPDPSYAAQRVFFELDNGETKTEGVAPFSFGGDIGVSDFTGGMP